MPKSSISATPKSVSRLLQAIAKIHSSPAVLCESKAIAFNHHPPPKTDARTDMKLKASE